MKSTTTIINTSRGALIDEAALIDALDRGRIAGAGIDTHALIDVLVEEIPPNAHPLLGRDNVILTPHVASGSVQAAQDIRSTAIANMLDILQGYWPPAENIVNPTVVPRYFLAVRP